MLPWWARAHHPFGSGSLQIHRVGNEEQQALGFYSFEDLSELNLLNKINWDTVGALGIPVKILRDILTPGKYEFHDTGLSHIVEYAAQALAIFPPTLRILLASITIT